MLFEQIPHELEKSIALYIHFYNTSRYQKRLNGLIPP
ncbi:IS3 family transposase [Sporosarcina sp. 6E9]